MLGFRGAPLHTKGGGGWGVGQGEEGKEHKGGDIHPDPPVQHDADATTQQVPDPAEQQVVQPGRVAFADGSALGGDAQLEDQAEGQHQARHVLVDLGRR